MAGSSDSEKQLRLSFEIFDSAEKSTALPDNLRTFKTILIDFDLFDNFYLSRQN